MGQLGILYGQPRHGITTDIANSAEKLANWIEREIPSFSGNVPVEYTNAISKVLTQYNIKPQIIQDAFAILEKRNVRFDRDPMQLPFSVHNIRIPAPTNPNVRPAPQMREITKGEKKRIVEYTFEEYERRYVLAIKTDDPGGAADILVAVLKLLWEWAQGHGEGRQMRLNEPMREWEDFNNDVNTALARAQTLQTHIRYMSREELTALRSASTPTAFRNLSITFANRVTTRTMPSTRRARR